MSSTSGIILVVLACGVGLGCAASPACRKGPKDDVVMAARTGGAAVETAAETGAMGVKAAGRTVGGLVVGGSDGAADEWKKGKAEVKDEAREGKAEVKDEANLPLCPE